MPLYFALDKFVSQQISKLTKCNAIDLSQEFNQADSWIENYVLNSILCIQVKDEYKPFIFGILRRAQMALVEYENGRKSLKDYADGDKNRISIYFRSLYHFEIAISLTYQAHELFMKITGARLFEKNDNSQLERLNRVYNVSKHLEPSNIPNSHLHAVWLTNEGICTNSTVLKHEELADMIKDICKLADKLSNPRLPDQEGTA